MRPPHQRRLEVRHPLHLQRGADGRALPGRQGRDQLAHRVAVVAAEFERRRLGAGRIRLIAHVAGQHVHFEDHRCALGIGAAHRALVAQAGLVEDEDRLAAHVSAGEVGLAAQADVDRLQLHPTRRQAVGTVVRLGGVDAQRLAAAAHRDLPGLRQPLRLEIERLDPHVRQAKALELRGQPLGALMVGRGPGDAAPELRMPLIAVAAGDLRLFDDQGVHALGRRWRRSALRRPATATAATPRRG